ncbi:MAG TPA: MBL fold metallo-hydrolase [Rhodanobacteraceae bacterium]|nr:MBL fold metallo-hydrolase [Rhodanobacteraceae bacterium]
MIAQKRLAWVATALLACFGQARAAPQPRYTLIPGSLRAGSEPDGNSVILDAPEGLIVVDTGRHPQHQEKILAFARDSKKPIVAIINSHWHLDHTGGNATLLKAYPGAQVYASTAIDGALKGFFPRSKQDGEQYLASGKATPGQAADIRLDIARIDEPAALRPTRPITASGTVTIAGLPLDVHLARFAATEGDVWVRDGDLVIAGDLVVAMVPFLDTACPEGWRRALDGIAAIRFETLIPGHGEPMTRPQFLDWRRAYDNLLDCSASPRSRQSCIDGWMKDAAAFIPQPDRERAAGMVGYYIDSRLRAADGERGRYCRPL